MEQDHIDIEELRATEALLEVWDDEEFPLLLNDEDLWFDD